MSRTFSRSGALLYPMKPFDPGAGSGLRVLPINLGPDLQNPWVELAVDDAELSRHVDRRRRVQKLRVVDLNHSIAVPIDAVLVCNCGMVDCTRTLSDTSPSDIMTSTRACEFTRSTMSCTVVVLNDCTDAVIV